MSELRSVSVEQRFHDELVALPKTAQRQVTRVLRDIRRDPFHDAARVATYRTIWRRRAGAYRILYSPTARSVHVHSVQHRGSVYQRTIPEADAPRTVPPTELLPEPSEQPAPTTGQLVVNALQLDKYGLDDELLEAISRCETTDSFDDLIELGIPETVFDVLWDEFRRRGAAPQQPTSWTVRLLKTRIVDAFFERVFAIRRSSPIADLTIVAPWITEWSGSSSSFDALERFITNRNLRVRVITRPPDFPPHKAAITRLRALSRVKVFFLPELHAKFMICSAPPVPFAVIGSANITTQSQSNFEVGVMVRGSGQAETVIRELEALTVTLQGFSKKEIP